MSTAPKDQSKLRHDAPRQQPRQAKAGEVLWLVRTKDGARIACELRDDTRIGAGVEVQLVRDGALLVGRRFTDRAAALRKADAWRADELRSGAVLVAG